MGKLGESRSQLRVVIKLAAAVGGWSAIPQRNSGKLCRTRQRYLTGRARKQKYSYPRPHWLRLPPMGVYSEYFQPEQPSKTLEKVPQEREDTNQQVEGRQTHTQRWYCLEDVPGSVLGAGTQQETKQRESCPHEAFLLLGRIIINRVSKKHTKCAPW